MSIVSIRAEAGIKPAGKLELQTRTWVGICLFVLLMFTSCTVFVRSGWPLQSFQIGIYALVAAFLLVAIFSGKGIPAGSVVSWLIYLVPAWGLVQIYTHTTASTYETRAAVLRWGSLAGVFLLSQAVGATGDVRQKFLNAFLCFATLLAVLCLAQLFTSEGQVLWMFPSGYPDVFGTFQNQNNYAQFVELALPIALWRMLCDGWRAWWYPLAGGILYGSVVGVASRAGVVLCTLELMIMLGFGLLGMRNPATGRRIRARSLVLAVIPVLALAFTLAVGWQRVYQRFHDSDLWYMRREFMIAAVDMVKHKPLTGYGLDTFPEVYQQHAAKDFPYYANHAHNDWAEFAADGGVPFLLLLLIPFAFAIPTAVRHPWGLGLIIVMLHACVDYPFPRPAVSGWMFAVLGFLLMSRAGQGSNEYVRVRRRRGSDRQRESANLVSME